ncbi:uncharacterized protein [Littorina saxatilis]|uniref:uncharacterized protein isoform X2 n=1 Tax=Littorina saxatilis TaxID=31220 RepID=UPI0038B4529D
MGCGKSTAKVNRTPQKSNNRNFPDGDVNKGALKKQIQRHLSAAVNKGSLKELEAALRMCEQYDVQPDSEYYKAIRKVEYLRIKEGLRDAVRRRHAGTLEKAIHIARASPFALQLASAISAADKLRAQLKQWRVHRHAPLDMEQATVSEIRSFKYPPSSVVTVMTAVHRLLGYRRRDVATWQQIQTLLGQTGPESLLQKVEHFKPGQVSVKTAQDVETLLNAVAHDDVLMASNGTARFYVWANGVMEKVYADLGKGKRKKKKK